MLLTLRIRQLAVVASLELEFGPGLQVLTGETGAGKSILVDALSLVLGARGGAELVRTGSEEATVEAVFDLTHAPVAVAEAVRAAVGESIDELIVRRVLRANGRSKHYLNGHLATAAEVQRATAGLVDICSQHEHHALADPAAHLGFLDAYAGQADARARTEGAHTRWREASAALEAMTAAWRAREDRATVIRFLLEELGSAKPEPGEEDRLVAERSQLAHAGRIGDAARRAEGWLSAFEPSAAGLLSRGAAELQPLVGVDPVLKEVHDQVESLLAAVEDAAREVGRRARDVVEDPARLAWIEDRLTLLRRLARKHGGDGDALAARWEGLQHELDALDHLDRELESLELVRQQAADEAIAAARALSHARREAAGTLGLAITSELAGLGMGDAKVEVEVASLDRRSGELEWEGARVTALGLDRVELLVAPNRGEPPRPLRRIASGGELSRALLAIKRVLAQRGPRVLHVFDEVDTGVGGGVAEAIGRKLAEVAMGGQVLCITHLAPIAVYADRHLHVCKRVEGDRTVVDVEELTDDQRVAEIARMMGGLVVEDATRAAARALLDQAHAAKAKRVTEPVGTGR